jgi:hypothetical protein
MGQDHKAGKARIRPRSKVGLALICSIFLSAGISWAGPAGYYGQRSNTRHGHSSNTDGGDALTPRTISVSGTATLATVVVSTMNVKGPANVEIMLSSADYRSVPNGSPQFSSMTVLVSTPVWAVSVSSVQFRLHYDCFTSSASNPVMTFNNDTGANYNGSGSAVTNASTINSGGTTTDNRTMMMGTTIVNANSSYSGDAWFRVCPGFPATRICYWSVGMGEFSPPRNTFGSGTYTGAQALTSVQLTNSTLGSGSVPDHKGPMTCHLELWAKPFQAL